MDRGNTGSYRRLLRTVVLGTGIVTLVLGSGQARATTITVDTTADEGNADGDCSLREAVLAANTNAAVDACSVGQDAATDEIRLASGATYDLTLPAPAAAADDPLGGDLDLANNAAGDDVVVQTELGDPATIRQTVAGQKVFTVKGTADFNRVVVTGGDAEDCGGAIEFLGAGTSSVAGGVLAANTARNGGAICNQASGSQLLVSDTTFVDNVADGGSGVGGGLYNANGTTSVTGSVFLRNSANGSGGAVNNNRNVADAVSVTFSCLLDNTDVAVANNRAALQDATGNWWGRSSGPSGAGAGGGDSVDATFDFGDFAVAPNPSCFPMELVRNAGFERPTDSGGPLDDWKPSLLDAGDGQSCAGGDCVLTLAGDGTPKRLEQTIRVAGLPGDVLVITASSRATGVPAGAEPYSVRVTVFHEDGSREQKSVRFSPGTHGLETLSKTIVTNESWKKVRVEIRYARPGGTVQFEQVGLTFESPPV